MNGEFNLSDKIIILRKGTNVIEVKDYCPVIHQEDVKEFIRLLKEMKGIEHDGSFVSIGVFRRFIDKLAGEKLI